ncbi:MAG: OmpA family protein, partial [Myxococcota bacterium]
VDDPLVYQDTNGDIQELVTSVLQLDLLAGARIGPLRLGVDVPIYLLSQGEPNGNETGLGDLGIDGKVSLLDKAVDLALGGRLFVPTSTVDTALGNPRTGYEISAIVSGDAGPVLLAANVGTRGGPATSLENVELNDAFLARVGAALAFSEVVDTALEFNASLPYSAPLSNIDGSPLEVLASAAIRPRESNWVVRAGAGTGLTTGIGSPDYRILLGLGWEPADDDDDETFVDEGPCPGEEEDLDGYEDDDGCPEPTLVSVLVVDDATGEPIDVAKVIVKYPGQRATGTTPFEYPFEEGEVSIKARAEGYQPAEIDYTVVNGPPVEAVVRLKPVDAPRRTLVRRKEIELADTIQFETNSAVIKSESFGLLDKAVAILVEYPEIKKLRIEGHTDQRGSAAYNMFLSRKRAESVQQYLVYKGIDASRLSNVGYGEERLEDPRNVPEAWDKNRRVDFFVEEWEPIEVEVIEVTDDMEPVDEE